MNNRRYWITVLCILAISFFVRAWGLADPGLWHDEAVSHFYASHAPSWIFRHSAGAINHPPLFFLLLRGWLSLIPSFDQFAVELLNVFFGVVTVAVGIAWARDLIGLKSSLLAGSILSIHPFHVHYSGELRMYALATLGLTCVFYFSSRLLKSPKEVPAVDLAGLVLSSIVALYSHSFTALPLFFGLLYVTWILARARRFRSMVVVLLGVLIPYAPWGYFSMSQAARIASDYWLPPFRWRYLPKLFSMWGGMVGPRTWSAEYVFGWSSLLTGFLVPVAFSLKNFDRPPVKLIWISLMGTLCLVVSLSLVGQSVFLYRTYVIFTPAVVVLAVVGYGGLELRGILITVIGLYLGYLGLACIRMKQNPPHQYVKEVSSWITERYRPGTVVVHQSGFTFFPSRFYHRHAFREYLLGPQTKERSIPPERASDLNVKRPLIVVFPKSNRNKLPDAWFERVIWSRSSNRGTKTYRVMEVKPTAKTQ